MLTTPIWKHFAAFIYDILPLLGIFLLTSFVVVLIRNGVEVEPHTWWFDLLIFAELAFYYIYSWKKGGQTLGMRAWRIKIVPNQPGQLTISWYRASIRFFVGIVSTILLGTGLFWKQVSKRQLSWMDLVSDSSTQIVAE